jgi:fused signal recognition particle receptor
MFDWFRRKKEPAPVAPAAVEEAPNAPAALEPEPEPAAVAQTPEAAASAPESATEPVTAAPAEMDPFLAAWARAFDEVRAEAAAAPPPPRSLPEKLAATAKALRSNVLGLLQRNPKLDEALLEELETALIQADLGVTLASELIDHLRTRIRKREFADAAGLWQALRADLLALIRPYAQPLVIPPSPRPFVILTVGVNGAGKTTTIGKLAMRFRQQGLSVMLAAGDTFRAAAVEQLKLWGERNQVQVIAQGSGSDSASVIFDALQAAKARGVDVLIADTAGRLHTQGHLMAELAKIKRVLGKIAASAPQETLLVIDGGTGQNALNQARQFHQAVGLTGIVVTKLDGTAKGGVVFALCRELKLPLRFIGVGEKREDLREFVAEDYVEAILPREVAG